MARATSRRTRKPEPEWVGFSDQELLDMRLKDLNLSLEGSPLQPRIEKLYSELEHRQLRFRPHCWISDEWFSPDGVPGIAIPFYLLHRRLMRLEKKQMLEVEGGTDEWCMRILRHEAGHTIDTAYRLHRRRLWREVFGKSTQPYPEHYQPKPYSKSYVVHLEPWYAQSHPSEDFAETFAVWLKPRSGWRSAYRDWPALKKLEFVNELMEDLQNKKPLVSSREHVDSLKTMTKTLREHYEEKQQRYFLDAQRFYDRDLKQLFSAEPEYGDRPTAASFLRARRKDLRHDVAHWTGQYQYVIDQVLGDMIARCSALKLRLMKSERQTQRDALVLLTVITMNYLHGGHHRIAL
jgi:hypothetical protein